MSSSKRAIKANDLKKFEVYSDPQFSPDGNSYAFVSTTINEDNDYVSNLYVQFLDKDKPIKWTHNKYTNIEPRFSPDGSQLIFQSDRSGIPQVWLLNVQGGEAQQLTTFKEGATKPSWSSDGEKIIFTASLSYDDNIENQQELSKKERKKTQEEKSKQPLIVNSLKYKSDGVGFHDGKRNQIIMYDIESKQYTQLTSSDADHTFQDISPDDNHVLFIANLNEEADYEQTNDLCLLNLSTDETSKLTKGKGSYHSGRFSPGGDKISCFGNEFEYSGATLDDLYIFDVSSYERTCLSSEWDFELGDAMIGDLSYNSSEVGPIWEHDEKAVYFIGSDHGATRLYKVELNGDLEIIYENNSHVFGFTYDSNQKVFILAISEPTDPSNFYFLNNNDLSQLTHANESILNEISLSSPEPLTVKADDGWDIQGWLLKPYEFKKDKKYPFILEVHGGPHAMYGQTFFHELQLLAAQGYVVLYMNPRGSHGYGQTFVDAVRTDYGGKDYTDLMSAVDYVLENYSFIDETRLGVTGGSYGGFMTNWIVSHTNRFKAAVTQRSISNWLSFYGVSDIGYFFTKWEQGYNLLDNPKKLWDFSPLKYAENVETPLLILHSELDHRCPIEQGEQLFITLKHLHKEVEFVRFPGESHNLSRTGQPDMRIERLNHILRWFEYYL